MKPAPEVSVSTSDTASRQPAWPSSSHDGGEPLTPKHDDIGALLDWWLALPTGKGKAPEWCADYVHQLRPWMGSLFVVRFPGGDRMAGQYTLSGTQLVRAFGFDMTGAPLTPTTFGRGSEQVMKAYWQAMDSLRPVYSRNSFTRSGRSTVHYERLALPFVNAEGVVDRILGVMYFLERPPEDWFDDTTMVIGVVDVTL